MDSTNTTVSDLIEGMDDATLRELHTHLQFKFNRKQATVAKPARTWAARYQYLFDALCEATNATHRNIGDFAQKYGEQKFLNDMQDLESYIIRGCQSRPTLPLQRAIAKACIACLVDHMYAWPTGRVITPTTVMHQLHRLPSAVDDAYPCYADAKLLDKVVAVADAA